MISERTQDLKMDVPMEIDENGDETGAEEGTYMYDERYVLTCTLVVTRDVNGGQSLAKLRVEGCVEEIDLWMCKNLLKLNQDNTELVVISSKFRIRPNLENVRVGDEFITP